MSAHTTRRAHASTKQPAHARRGRLRLVDTTARSRLGARSAYMVSALIEPSRRCDGEVSRRRDDATRRSAAHTTRHARALTEQPANARRGQRRSADTTTRSRIGVCLASPVSALIEPRRRCDEESAAHTTGRARASTERTAYAPRGRRRSVDTVTRSRLSARSASPVSALLEPSRRCDEESARRVEVTRRTAAHTRRARGTVMSLDPCRLTRHGAHMRQRNNQRTHDVVGCAW